MIAQPSATTTPAHVFVADRETRKVKAHHQWLQHVINRMTGRMGFPDKAARCVAGLHGLLNGRELHSFPALIAHRFAARQFNYAGKEENADVFMGRYLDALKDAEIKAGRKCFEIERANGATTIITTYHADYIGEAALWALTEARASEEWKKNPAQAVTDKLIDSAIAKLPVPTPPKRGAKSEGPSVTDDAIIKGMWTRIDTATESAMRKVALAGGDPLAELEKAHRRQRRIAAEVRREQLERDRAAKDAAYYETLDWLADTGTDTSGKNISDNSEKFSTADASPSDGAANVWHPTICRMPPPQIPEGQQVNFEAEEKDESPKLSEALISVAEGIPVLALWGVADGMCDCPLGSECRSPGKHPYPRFCPNGVHSATLDPAKVRMWCAKDPRINFGQRMGGERNIVCVDVDPRNGGSESYFDLVEHFGDEAFPATREKATGGAGWHKLYALPEVIKATGELKAKLAPGIDVKGEGGYVVAPLATHVSGRIYERDNGLPIAPAPAWLVERIRKAAGGERSDSVVNFQAHREQRRSGQSGTTIGEGERNERLFKLGCALWGSGEVSGHSELYARLLDANDERCSPPLVPSEVRKIANSICRYPRGTLIQEGAI